MTMKFLFPKNVGYFSLAEKHVASLESLFSVEFVSWLVIYGTTKNIKCIKRLNDISLVWMAVLKLV
jgi:hypothetical protein